MHRVPITHRDLVRLVEATGQPPEALVEWASSEQVDLSGEPSSFALLDVGARAMFLCHAGGACLLLGSDRRCSVHAARPAACRTFPLHATLGPRGGIRRLRVLRAIDCPVRLDGVSDIAVVRRDHARLQRELREYQRVLAEWNRMQRHRKRFGHALRGARELFEFLRL